MAPGLGLLLLAGVLLALVQLVGGHGQGGGVLLKLLLGPLAALVGGPHGLVELLAGFGHGSGRGQ